MSDEEKKRSVLHRSLTLVLTAGLLALAWVVPPLLQRARRLCPVRPDGVSEAAALPAFARQTGMSCAMCHTVFPQLTPYGRRFKLNGYTLTAKPADVSDYAVGADTASEKPNLALSYVSPFNVAIMATYSKYSRAPVINANPAAGTPESQYQGDQVSIPAEIGLFYAGRVSDNLGTLIQLDYDSSSADNSVKIGPSELVRWADHTEGRGIVYGATLTNAPGDADIYDTSAHGTPFLLFDGAGLAGRGDGASTAGNGAGTHLNAPYGVGIPAAGPAGFETYAMIDDSLYVQYGAYHAEGSGLLGGAASGGQLSGIASRGRIAYEKNWDRNSLMVGAYASKASALPYFVPGAAAFGYPNMVNAQDPAVAYLDGAADWEYEYIGDEHIFSFYGSVVHERQSNDPSYVATTGGGTASLLNAYSNRIDYLNQTQLIGSYFYRRRYGVMTSWINTTGTKDRLLRGADGSPDNQYWQIQLDYLPFLNTKLFVEYDVFTKVDGAQSPFYLANGAGGVNGKASDNNMIELGLWMDF
jgi:hypothetical protein